jgi:hypothetical protein
MCSRWSGRANILDHCGGLFPGKPIAVLRLLNRVSSIAFTTVTVTMTCNNGLLTLLTLYLTVKVQAVPVNVRGAMTEPVPIDYGDYNSYDNHRIYPKWSAGAPINPSAVGYGKYGDYGAYCRYISSRWAYRPDASPSCPAL